MSSADRDLPKLFHLTRTLREPGIAPLSGIERLYGLRFEQEAGGRAMSLSLDQSTLAAWDRERRVRRHLDRQFSLLFQEIVSRSRRVPERTLILEEPIYYLTLKARERNFPKSRGRIPHLPSLKMRFHLDLAAHLNPEGFGEDGRRVLLPYEL